jgi:hypothetical protein
VRQRGGTEPARLRPPGRNSPSKQPLETAARTAARSGHPPPFAASANPPETARLRPSAPWAPHRHSLVALATKTDANDRDLDLRHDDRLLDLRDPEEYREAEVDRGGWPDPIRPVATAPSRALTGRKGSERSGPGPVLTGRWGRVPVPRPGPAPPEEVDEYPPWYRRSGTVAFAPPPPPPPAPARRPRLHLVRLRAAATLRRIARSRRWRFALVEIAIAAAIIGTVAAVTSRPARAPEQLQASWGRQAIPTITALIDDLTPVQREVMGIGTTKPNVSAVDLVSLRSGLVQAEKLRPPPMPAVAAAWRAALSEITDGLHLLEPAGPFPPASTAAGAASALFAAGQHLLEVGQTIPVS